MSESSMPVSELQKLSREARRLVLEMAFRSQTAHLGPALGIVDILIVLYFSALRIRPEEPAWEDRDRFILSKGHAASALYAALALRGFFPESELTRYCVDGGRFHGHPCRDAAPGIEFSTGSLGHGLSVAAGIALGLRETKPDVRVMALLGDGECNEGSVWESAMFIATRKLNNVVAIIDMNKFQGFGATAEVQPMDFPKQWSAFGWRVVEVSGHDHEALVRAFDGAKTSSQPTVIIADTVSGKGMKAIEHTLRAHYVVPDAETHAQAMRDIYAE